MNADQAASPPPAPPLPLACPRCDKWLTVSTEGHDCGACNVTYPTIDGVPWLFADPQAALTEWRLRIDAHLADLLRKATNTRRALSSNAISAAARARMEHLLEAYERQRGVVAELMKPVRPAELGALLATHLALKTRLPPTQGLTSYHANLHRDWAWGDDENKRSWEMVTSALPTVPRGAQLVLGAGAARLAYDLSQSQADTDVVALDVNPLLMLAARRIAAGEAIEQVEFPLAPIDSQRVAVTRILSAPSASPHLHCVLADALRPPFAPASFAAVITPWFVDVVDEDLPVLAARINRLLAPGGRWVIFGSLTFDHPDPARRYGMDEVIDAVTTAGFDSVHDDEQVIPYMCSPASRHGRRERVVAIGATKTAEVATPSRHSALPAWLVQGTRPVPLLEPFKVQATTTRIYAFVMSMIDGKRSLRDMAALMEEQKLMPKREAETAIRGFLIRMFDEAQQPPPH